MTATIDFFVSYTGKDQAWAEWIAWELEHTGYSVRIQAWDFNAGGVFPADMHRALKESARLIAVLTPAYLESDFCQPEWQAAFARDPTGKECIMIGVRVVDFKPDGLFAGRTYIDLVGLPEFDARRKLLERVKTARKKPHRAPGFPGPSGEAAPQYPGARPPAIPAQSLRVLVSSDSRTELAQRVFGESRRKLLFALENSWLQSGGAVGILQGFSGTGKTSLASAISNCGWITLDPIQVSVEPENREVDFLIDIVTSLDANGVSDLADSLRNAGEFSPLEAIERLIRRERVLVIVDEFQRLFSRGETCPPEPWQEFVERLNNAASSRGRVLLISNRLISPDRWNESCVIVNLDRFPDTEAAAFLSQCLAERDLVDRVPSHRLVEVGRRLGGNPRAIKTLVGSLVYSTIDELISTLPDRLETGDVQLDPQLLEKFERGLISRAIDHLEANEVLFMRWLAVNRLPFGREYYAGIEAQFIEVKRLRNLLIDRFLIESNAQGDSMHPLAREIAVSRLRETKYDWRRANSAAADYHMARFTTKAKSGSRPRIASFVELRHHLFEAERQGELTKVGDRMRELVLSYIPKPTHSKTPRSTEILDEHIVMIESLPPERRTKGLTYHLALCLRARNAPGDAVEALRHAKDAVSKDAYYAVWLLLADLEFAINGSEALKRVTTRAQEGLGAGSNAFAIYYNCADLLSRDGRGNDAIDFLEEAIKTPGVACKPSLIALCARILERMGDSEKALAVLQREMSSPRGNHPGIAFTYWASMLVKQGRWDEAIQLADQGIGQPGMTKLFALYQIKADALTALANGDAAKRVLREGIADKRVIDTAPLYCGLAKLLANEGQFEEAVILLQGAVVDQSVRHAAPLFHSTAEILEKEGKFDLAAQLLIQALHSPQFRCDHTIYLACARMHFRARDLEKARVVLEAALAQPGLRERNEVIVKLAELIYRLGQPRASIDVLRRAIEVEHDTRHLGNIYLYCAQLMEKEGEHDEAERVLRKGIEAPAMMDKGVLVQALAKKLGKRQCFDEAVSLLRQAIEWPGMSGVVILYQAWATILLKAGRPGEAIEMLEEAIKRKTMGNLPSLYLICAEAMMSSGRCSDAVELLTRGLAKFPKDQGLQTLFTKVKAKI